MTMTTGATMPVTRAMPTIGAQRTTVVAGKETTPLARRSFCPKASLSCFTFARSSKWSSTTTAPTIAIGPMNTRGSRGRKVHHPMLRIPESRNSYYCRWCVNLVHSGTSYFVYSELAGIFLVLPCHVLSCRVLPCLVLSCLVSCRSETRWRFIDHHYHHHRESTADWLSEMECWTSS